MADARSASPSGARRHSSPDADTKQASAFRYSVSVMTTLGLECVTLREFNIDSVSTGFLFFGPRSPFGHGAVLTADIDTGSSSTRSPIVSGAAALGETRVRYKVLAMTMALGAITYLDRVTISVTRPDVARDLDLSPTQMGYVFSAFYLA